ncbi:MAG: tetratricopeptide repeat protein [Lysobacterales bacterium]
MKYDDSEYGFLNFETELDNDCAATHIGMYLAWAILRGLAGEEFDQRETPQVLALKARQTTGREVLLDLCDGKLTDDDFNAVGNAFTSVYYERYFVKDYERVFQADFPNTGHPTDDFCGIPDTWANFDRLAPLLDKRFAQWQQARSARPEPQANSVQPPSATLSLEPLAQPSIDELRRRGEHGEAQAWYELAARLLTGDGTKQDVVGGIEAFRRAAELGHLESTYNLGVAYQNGDGVAKDASTALEWFTRAADAGHGFATFMLAQAYRVGNLVPTDIALSNALLIIAGLRGVREASSFGIVAGYPYADLVIAMKEPGTLRAVLQSRLTPVQRSSSSQANRPTQRGPAPTPTPANADHGAKRDTGIMAVLATMIGAVGVFVLLLFATRLTGLPFRLLAYGIAVIGAIGVFRISQRMGESRFLQLILTLGAAVPAFGSFVCMLVLYRWWMRPRQE